MAGRNAAAAEAALLLILHIWESLILEKYMKEACQSHAVRCPTCNSPRTCNNYFCLQCKTGGLCPIVFRGDREHRHHPWLQVRHYTRQYSVLLEDLEPFISQEGLKHIHTVNKLDGGERHCNLRSKRVVAAGASTSSSSITRTRAAAAGEKSCHGCMANIRGSQASTETFLVCSLQCLVKVARERSQWNLLAMKDGAMELMKPPLLYTEKLLKQPPMLETPTKTPKDETPPSPQEVHEDRSVESTLAALPVPPATEDCSMVEEPSAAPAPPAVTPVPKLETFALPLKYRTLDLSPDWVQNWMYMDLQ